MHYPERFQVLICFFFKDHSILRTKSILPGTILGDNFFFFRDDCILRTKSALLGTISGDDHFFFRDHCIFWDENCIASNNFVWRSLDFKDGNCIT